jgi:nucleotide-binding universal stress UspA family protein
VDHTEQSLQAVRFALAYAGDGDELTLLHVVPPFPSKYAVNRIGEDTIREYQMEDAKAELAAIRDLLADAQVPHTLEIEFGEIPDVICKYANQSYDSVIMGTHGYGRVSGFLMQSVSYPTIHDVSIPVFLISEETDAARFPWRKVLIAVDGSEHAKEAVLQAIQASRNLDVEYTLLTVVPLSMVHQEMFGAAWMAPDSIEKWGQAILEPYEELMKEKNLRYTSKVMIGDPASIIRHTAEKEADLLVVGHRGQGGVVGTLMGSVTFKLIHRTKIPLLVVKK